MTAPNPRDPALIAESVVSGIFRNRSTMETQVYLDGRLIGACALGLPHEAFQMWLRRIVERLTPAEVARIYGGRLIDGSES